MKKKLIIILVLIAVAIGGWYGYNEYNRKNKDLADVDTKIMVTAGTLVTDFEKDSATANQKYLGAIIAVTGTVKSIEKENGGTVVLSEPGAMSSVRCSMDTTHLNELNAIKEGQQIKIKGACTGYQPDEMGLGADVILNRCVIETK
ncbi:MAG TPA: hypothetical protein VM888_13640 [Chitinophagaceae bacterium]|nr:hypothetical protein [Chitinophagaceae bacterium]